MPATAARTGPTREPGGDEVRRARTDDDSGA